MHLCVCGRPGRASRDLCGALCGVRFLSGGKGGGLRWLCSTAFVFFGGKLKLFLPFQQGCTVKGRLVSDMCEHAATVFCPETLQNLRFYSSIARSEWKGLVCYVLVHGDGTV